MLLNTHNSKNSTPTAKSYQVPLVSSGWGWETTLKKWLAAEISIYAKRAKRNIFRRLRVLPSFSAQLSGSIVTPGNHGAVQNLSLLVFSMKILYPLPENALAPCSLAGHYPDIGKAVARLLPGCCFSETSLWDFWNASVRNHTGTCL